VEGDGLLSAERAVELAPGSAEALDVLGYAQFLNGSHAEAGQSLARAIALDPELASAHFHLGLVNLETQQADLARQNLENAIALDAGGPVAERALKALARLGISALPTPVATAAP
jgi:Flp pilus assembly protein TadD